MIIETKRLSLREMDKNDFDALYGILADADIMEVFAISRGQWADLNRRLLDKQI